MIYTYMTQLIKKSKFKDCRESRIIERFQLLFQD